MSVALDAPVLAGTLRENLTLGAPDASEQQCVDVLHAVNLTEVLERNELGLAAPVGEDGVMLLGAVGRVEPSLDRSLDPGPCDRLSAPASLPTNARAAALSDGVVRGGRSRLGTAPPHQDRRAEGPDEEQDLGDQAGDALAEAALSDDGPVHDVSDAGGHSEAGQPTRIVLAEPQGDPAQQGRHPDEGERDAVEADLGPPHGLGGGEREGLRFRGRGDPGVDRADQRRVAVRRLRDRKILSLGDPVLSGPR